MLEIWKDIKGYEGLYQVSNTGKVRSLNYHRMGVIRELKLIKHHCGYLEIGLKKNGKRKIFKVHRLVAEAFIPNPDNLPQVNHKDECKTNNCVDNLEWCDVSYNCNYGTRNERMSRKLFKTVLQFTLNGDFIKEYESVKEVTELLGLKQSTLSSALTGRNRTAGGFIWKYK